MTSALAVCISRSSRRDAGPGDRQTRPVRMSLCVDPGRSWRETAALAQRVDAGGWHAVYLCDHFTPHDPSGGATDGPVLECWTTLRRAARHRRLAPILLLIDAVAQVELVAGGAADAPVMARSLEYHDLQVLRADAEICFEVTVEPLVEGLLRGHPPSLEHAHLDNGVSVGPSLRDREVFSRHREETMEPLTGGQAQHLHGCRVDYVGHLRSTRRQDVVLPVDLELCQRCSLPMRVDVSPQLGW